MLSDNFVPQFPVDLIEKDFGYTLKTVGNDSMAPTIAAARSVFGAAIEHGHGKENMTAVVKLFT
jgi:3-hydroxyisobutyrate dehydrogenase